MRLLHQLGNFSVPWGDYRGRRFVGFTLDLSHWTGTRSERIQQIEFWAAGGREQLRRAGLVYTPGRADAPLESTVASTEEALATADPGPVNWEQPPLFEDEGRPEGSD